MSKMFGSSDISHRPSSPSDFSGTSTDITKASDCEQSTDMGSGVSDTAQITHESLEQRLDDVIKTKAYVHWETPEAKERNRAAIDNYDAKKRAVDKATLMTQRETLLRYRDCFDQDAIKRMWSELDSNKTEIYNEPYFKAEKAPGNGRYEVVGMRDVIDGKICIRDCDNLDTIVHTATHETMHDLSFQGATHDVSHLRAADGEIVTTSHETHQSGLFNYEKTRTMFSDGTESVVKRESGRSLNEGMTEMYTIEAMYARGEYPRFDSYTRGFAWAMRLREIVGEDVVAQAYFGGDVAQLEGRVNSMSPIDNAWAELNRAMDAYHEASASRPYDQERVNNTKSVVDAIFDGMMGSKEYGSRRIRQ